MRSLFLRIFLWFWLVIAAIIAVLVGLSPYWTRSHPAIESWERVTLEHLDGLLDDAEDAGPRQRPTGERPHGRRGPGPRRFVFDADGAPAPGTRRVPDDVAEVVAEVVATGLPASRRQGFHFVVARWAETSPGERRIVAAAAPARRPPPRPVEVLGRQSVLLRLVVVGVIVGVLCWWLSRYLTSPLRALSAATRRLAAGDLGSRVSPRVSRRRDEIGELARDFDAMAERLEGLVASHRRLLRDVSHELRSPLARLGVALELARGRAGDAARPALDRVGRESERLNELIAQLLELARLEETERPESALEEVELDALVAEVVADADFEARARDASVLLARSEPCRLRGEPRLLRAAVENVLRNAVRWTAPGTAVEVELFVEDGGTALLRVRDHGPGVPEEALGRLLEPFFRVEEARDRQRGGVGLGLAIAARALERHGGGVRAVNHPEGGLEVELRLPVL